jgi:hypothetical protein
MKRISLEDTAEFRQGRKFEQDVARYYLLRNYYVERCYSMKEEGGKYKAPMLEGPFSGYRVPDLKVMGGGKTSWVECKEKEHADYTRCTGQLEHGIGRRCYMDYLKVQQISGIPVFLCVGEWEHGLIRIASLDALGGPRYYNGNKMDPGGMVFWPRDRFRLIGSYSSIPDQLEWNMPREIKRIGE